MIYLRDDFQVGDFAWLLIVYISPVRSLVLILATKEATGTFN